MRNEYSTFTLISSNRKDGDSILYSDKILIQNVKNNYFMINI